MGGYFNETIGQDDSSFYKKYKLCPSEGGKALLPLQRKSKDGKINYAGHMLLQVVNKMSLCILNGSYPNEFMYWSGERMSLLYDIIVSEKMMGCIHSFEVGGFLHAFSDTWF